MNPIIERNGIKIFVDECPANPRTEWDNLGKMVCFHKKYILGDQPNEYNSEDYNSWDDLAEDIEKDHGPCCILPVYMLDHSGICIDTQDFCDPWDSGQIGFLYCSEARALDEGVPLDKLKAQLEAEVQEYNRYLSGQVYGYIRRTEKYKAVTDKESRIYIYGPTPNFILAQVFNDEAAELLVDALNKADPEEESCWGFYMDPEELLELVTRGEV